MASAMGFVMFVVTPPGITDPALAGEVIPSSESEDLHSSEGTNKKKQHGVSHEVCDVCCYPSRDH